MGGKRGGLRAAAAALSLGMVAAAGIAGQAEGDAAEGYRIGPSDVLAITVWRNTELTSVVTVRPDGMISLPLLNEVKAAGRTPSELREILTQQFAEQIPSPKVFVGVNEAHAFKVAVMGKVKRPDRYELRVPTTLLEILAQAGGFETYGYQDDILVLRSDGGKTERITVSYRRMIGPEGQSENLRLRPNDIVVVP
jgi:polysaccharide export outer membrane protein